MHRTGDGGVGAARDYHGHPNYVAVWAALAALLVMSLAVGWLARGIAAVALIFGLAAVKAWLVLGNFMHLRWEPRFVWGIAAVAVLCLVFLSIGVAPDIVHVPLTLAK